MANRWSLYRLGLAMIIVFWILVPVNAEETTTTIGGTSYAVVDRIDLSAHPGGLVRTIAGPKAYKPGIDTCMGAGSPASRKADNPFRVPDAKSSGFSATLLRVRLVSPPPFKPDYYGGSLEVALFNPCSEPIAVPIVEADAFNDELPQEGRFDSRQLLLMFLAGGEGEDSVLSGGYVLAGTADRKQTYRILQQHEAVVFDIPLQISTAIMPQHDLERLLSSIRMEGVYFGVFWSRLGEGSTDGTAPWNLPYYDNDVRIEVGK